MATSVDPRDLIDPDSGTTNGSNKRPPMTESELISAIWAKLDCLVDPNLLFKEVNANMNILTHNVDKLRKDMEMVKKEIDLLKNHRLKQFMWVKENLTKLELEKEALKDDMEKRTNALTRCMWMTEGAIRDHVLMKDSLSTIPDITGLRHHRSPSNASDAATIAESTTSEAISAASTVVNTPNSPISSMSTISGSENPSPLPAKISPIPIPATTGGIHLHSLENALPQEEPGLGSRLTAAIMSINSRMHDLERSQVQWKQTYGIQVNGLRAQMQQVQQDAVETNIVFEEVMKLKKLYEDPEEKGLETKFMHLCADLVSKLHGRVENLERNLEREKNGEFKAFAKGACGT